MWRPNPGPLKNTVEHAVNPCKRWSESLNRASGKKAQEGGVAIEFAALFVIFFAIIYAIIAYSLPVFITLTFSHLSAEAARSALRVDPAQEEAAYIEKVSEQVTAAITDGWIPTHWVDGDCPPPDDQKPWFPLPASGSNPSFGHMIRVERPSMEIRFHLHVCIQRKYNDSANQRERAIVPTIRIGSFEIPSLPKENGNAILRGSSMTYL